MSGNCLYNSMKAAGLGDVDAVKDWYIQFLKQQLEIAMEKDINKVVAEDPTLDQTVMGSANFLQVYQNHHPDIAFILQYKNPTSGLTTDWLMIGAVQPRLVVRMTHSGSVDGGHFTYTKSDEFDLQRAISAFRCRTHVF